MPRYDGTYYKSTFLVKITLQKILITYLSYFLLFTTRESHLARSTIQKILVVPNYMTTLYRYSFWRTAKNFNQGQSIRYLEEKIAHLPFEVTKYSCLIYQMDLPCEVQCDMIKKILAEGCSTFNFCITINNITFLQLLKEELQIVYTTGCPTWIATKVNE